MKWLPPLVVGILIGAGFTFAIETFLAAPKISETDWKTLQTRAQAQTVEIARQQKEIATKSAAIEHLQKTAALSGAAARPTANPAKPANPLAGLATLMDSPAMKKMMAAQQERMVEDNYADLIAQFHFTPEERAQFVKLLVAKQSIGMEDGLKILQLSPDERKKFVSQQSDERKKADAAIREFFNDEKDFATYTAYTEEQTRNYAMKALRPAMKFAGEPLTSEQEKSLGEIIRTEGKNTPKTPDDAGMPPTADSTARMLAEEAQRQERIAASAASILSPAQLEVLRKSQASQLQMMKAGAEMSQSILGE